MRIVSRRSVLVLAALAALSVPACSSGETGGPGSAGSPHTVTLTVDDTKVTPNRIAAAPGETLRVVVTNAGTTPHSLSFEIPGSTLTLGRTLAPGETAQMTVVAPMRPGAYDFLSPIGDDRKKGVSGALIVAQPGVIPQEE